MLKPDFSAVIRRTLTGVMACGVALGAFAAGNQPYIYDYYQGTDPAAYVESYTGTPFKNHTIDGTLVKIEAEDFDNGEEMWYGRSSTTKAATTTAAITPRWPSTRTAPAT